MLELIVNWPFLCIDQFQVTGFLPVSCDRALNVCKAIFSLLVVAFGYGFPPSLFKQVSH